MDKDDEEVSGIFIPSPIWNNLPSMVQNELSKLPAAKQEEFLEEYKRRAKKTNVAYVLCFLFGAHYAYLDKWGIWPLFSFTIGGILIWWIIDLFRIPSMVKKYNQNVAVDILRDMKIISDTSKLNRHPITLRKKIFCTGLSILFAIGFIATFFEQSSSNQNTTTKTETETISIGAVGYLTPELPGMNDVILGDTIDDLTDVINLEYKRDATGLMQMALIGQAFFVKEGTKAEAIGLGPESLILRVKILNSDISDQIGMCGWINSHNFHILPGEQSSEQSSEQETVTTLIPYRMGYKWGYIDTKGNLIILPIYDDAWPFSEGLAAVNLNGKYGFIDKKGNLVIQPTYDDARAFSEGLAAVRFGEKWGYIDTKGNLATQPIYDDVKPFSEGLAQVQLNDSKWVYIDTKGNIVFQPKYDWTEPFSEGLASVEVPPLSDMKWGYIDMKGNLVIQPKYYFTNDFSEGLAAVGVGESIHDVKWGFIDKKGNYIIQPIYDDADHFSEGLAAVGVGESIYDVKWGYIDKKGNLIIQPIYDGAFPFSEGLAAVGFGELPNRKWGFIDTKGNLVIQPVYGSGGSFSKGFIRVMFDGEWGYIDTKGNQYWEGGTRNRF